MSLQKMAAHHLPIIRSGYEYRVLRFPLHVGVSAGLVEDVAFLVQGVSQDHSVLYLKKCNDTICVCKIIKY